MDSVFYTSFERAVVDLERAVCRDRSHVVLVASSGPDRAALTAVLEERLSDSLRPLEIPVPTAPRDEICARIVHRLAGDAGETSEQRLAGLLREVAVDGSALLLLIRDADSMPVETLEWLGQVAAESGKGLRLVLVVTATDGSQGDLVPGLIAALGVGAQKVVLEAPGDWARQVSSGSPGSAGSPDAGPAYWADPLRSRVETIRSLTVRPPASSRSRWRGYAIFATALALIAFGVHHLTAVSYAPGLAAPPEPGAPASNTQARVGASVENADRIPNSVGAASTLPAATARVAKAPTAVKSAHALTPVRAFSASDSETGSEARPDASALPSEPGSAPPPESAPGGASAQPPAAGSLTGGL